MPTKIGAVFIDLGLKSDAFDKGVAASEIKLKSLAATATGTALSFSKNMLGSLASATAGFLTLDAVVGKMNEALEQFGNIADKSRSAGLNAEFFQGIAYAASQSGVGIDQVSAALNAFNKNAGLAAIGKGELYSQLQVLNPELLRTIQLATTQEERILAVANALSKETSASKQAALATASFGDAGTSLVAVLEQGAASLTKFIQRAKEAGIVVEESIIRRADDIGDKIDEANTILDTKLKVSALNFGNLSLWVKGVWVDLVDKMGYAVNRFDEINNRNYIQPLQVELKGVYDEIDTAAGKADRLREAIASGAGPEGWQLQQLELKRTEDRLDVLKTKANELLSRIQVLQGYQPPAAPVTPVTPAAPVNPNMMAGLDMGLAADPILLAGGGGVAGGTNPIVTGLGRVDVALEASKKNMADWAVSFDAEINATGAAMEALALKTDQAWSGTADMLGGAFSDLASLVGNKTKESFELSKKLSMASSVVAGIEASMQAFKKGTELGGIPLGVLWGGIAATTAAAKLAAIGSTTFDSTSLGAGAAASAAPAAAAAAPVGQTQGVNITLQGGFFTGQQVMGLFGQLQDALGMQGKMINVTHINGA